MNTLNKIIRKRIAKKASLVSDFEKLIKKLKIKIPSKQKAIEYFKSNKDYKEDIEKAYKIIPKILNYFNKTSAENDTFGFPKNFFKNLVLLAALAAITEGTLPLSAKDAEKKVEKIVYIGYKPLGKILGNNLEELAKGSKSMFEVKSRLIRAIRNKKIPYRGKKLPAGVNLSKLFLTEKHDSGMPYYSERVIKHYKKSAASSITSLIEKNKIEKSIKNILTSNGLAALSTSNQNIPNVCTVFYAHTHFPEIFFLSESTTNHIKNINSNSLCSMAIYTPNKIWGSSLKGLQLFGNCKKYDFESASIVYKNRHKEYGKWIENLSKKEKSELKSEFFSFVPHKIKILDESIFGEENFIEVKISRDFNFKGIIEIESLNNVDFLKDVRVVNTYEKNDKGNSLTFLNVTASSSSIDLTIKNLMLILKKGWYSFFWNNMDAYFVFKNKTFKIDNISPWNENQINRVINYGENGKVNLSSQQVMVGFI